MDANSRTFDREAGVRNRTTILTLADKYNRGEPIVMMTAYDYPTARAVDAASVDAILVGDSLGMVVLGHPNTLSVTMDEMLHHARAVARGTQAAMLIGDMPFMSYQADIADAVRNAGRFVQEGGMDAVKLEGGRSITPLVKAIVDTGIPVQGHIGLTPQSVHMMGGFRVQGRTVSAALKLLDAALALQDAGCFSIVIEGVPDRVASYITRHLQIPTIGIGAGAGTSGQVLVLHDLIGLTDGHVPKFVKQFAKVGETITEAVRAFRLSVLNGTFPTGQHSYSLPDEEWDAFLAQVQTKDVQM